MRRQLRDSFRTAFGKNRSSKYPSASRSSCGEVLGIIDDDESINTSETSESVDEMKNIIKEKDQKLKESDRRLTDVRLAALSYQHERDQLLDELQVAFKKYYHLLTISYIGIAGRKRSYQKLEWQHLSSLVVC